MFGILASVFLRATYQDRVGTRLGRHCWSRDDLRQRAGTRRR